MGNLTKYRGLNTGALQKQHEEAKSFTESDFMNLTEGKNVLRFMPFPLEKIITTTQGQETDESIFEIVMQHFIRATDEMKPAVFACPRLHWKCQCIGCKATMKLAATGNPLDQKIAKGWEPNFQVYANVIDRKNEEKGPRVLRFGRTIYNALCSIAQDEEKGGDFTDPGKDGFDIIITRTGTKKENTKYEVQASRKSSALGDEAWIEMQHDLRQFKKKYTDKELLKLLSSHLDAAGSIDLGGAVSSSREPADDEEKPERKPAASTQAKPRRNAEDDLEDDDGDNVEW